MKKAVKNLVIMFICIVAIGVPLLICNGREIKNVYDFELPDVEQTVHKTDYCFVGVRSEGIFLLSRKNFGNAFRMFEIPVNNCLMVTESCGRYLLVTTGGSFPVTGYVFIDDVKQVEIPSNPFYKLSEGKISANKTFLYSRPDDYSETKTVLKKGDTIFVYGEMFGLEEWFYVKAGEYFGYVKKQKARLNMA